MSRRDEPAYERVILKLSGEALMGEQQHGIDAATCARLADEIREIHQMGVRLALVVGGGNIFRGQVESKKFDLDRAVGDYMGMLATVLNGLALQNALEKKNIPTRVMSALEMQAVAEPYIRRRAIRHLEKGRVVIFVAGTGNPFFTTDTTAALRAAEIGAQVILKATKVDGVFSDDPVLNQRARRYRSLKFIDVLKRNLRVMDATAVSMCMDNQLPIVVFDINKKGNIKKAILGQRVGTLIH